MNRTTAIAALLTAAAATANGQVVINEVFENPPGGGSTDARFEYVELYGKPGLSLDGYAIALLKGGADPDGDDIPGPNPGDLDADDLTPEIDEIFYLDGLSLDNRGFLVVYNDTGAPSFIPGLSPAGAATVGWEALFQAADGQDCVDESAGNFANDTSSTYVLLKDREPFAYNFCGSGLTNQWVKDRFTDMDYDGKIDFGTETVVPGVFFGNQTAPLAFEPYQMVDDVAWSNSGGKEYVRSSQQEISDTPGFNPDAISRLAYYGENPNLGSRFNSDGVLVPTRTADEEWVYGEIPNLANREYEITEAKGPTDQTAAGYDGTCNPDENPACPSGTGSFLFDDVDLTGFALTPGDFNDSSTLTQFRWVAGDIDFDGDADADDYQLLLDNIGATGAERTPLVDDTGMPVLGPDGMQVMAFEYQGRDFNAIMVMKCIDETDGIDGTNAGAVTQADADLYNTTFGPFTTPGCGPADVTTDGTSNGIPDNAVTLSDFSFYLSLWSAGDNAADLTTDGTSNGIPDNAVTLSDFSFYLGLWSAGCP